MKRIIFLLLLPFLFLVSCNDTKIEGNKVAVVKTMKMTTDIPEGISTPNKMSTKIGGLNFFDGVPLKETEDKVTIT